MTKQVRPYYTAYEDRYRTVYDAGGLVWGHTAGDPALRAVLHEWVTTHDLAGKGIVEFACGEGACGVILSEMGCRYQGADIAPSAVEKAREALSAFPEASVSVLDMVRDRIPGPYDGGLDVMGLHMLVVDNDRRRYLANVYACLTPGAPMLFYRESFRSDAGDEPVDSEEAWRALTGEDYNAPEARTAPGQDGDVTVNLRRLPARAKSRAGYAREMEAAGFLVDGIRELAVNRQIAYSAAIFVYRP